MGSLSLEKDIPEEDLSHDRQFQSHGSAVNSSSSSLEADKQ